MSTDIIEAFLDGIVYFEVADNTTASVTWVDLTDSMSYANATRGGRPQPPGTSQTEIGILSAGFVDLAATVNVGYWARIRISTNTIWAGYVQNVDTVTRFDTNATGGKYVLTNVTCADWVGVAAGVIIDGNATSTAGISDTATNLLDALNNSYAAGFDVLEYNFGANKTLSFTDESDTFAGHLDTMANSIYDAAGGEPMRWHSTKQSPTTNHTPTNALKAVYKATAATSTGLTFTDVAGGTNLHYSDLTVSSSTREVVNSIDLVNRARLVGSSNPKLRVIENHTETIKDTASIAINGERRAQLDTRFNLEPTPTLGVLPDQNLVWNPNVQESSQYWVVDNSALSGCRRFAPSREATPFNAYEGDYAMRRTVLTATSNVTIMYAHDNEEGIPVTGGLQYRFVGRGARYTSLTDLQIRADLIWYDDNSAVISTVSSAQVALTNIRTWYGAGVSGTAPATAVSAKVRLVYTRSGGANLTVGTKVYADGYHVFRVNNLTETMGYFSGDTEDTTGNLYVWLGDPYRSISGRYQNDVYTWGLQVLDYAASPVDGIRSIRWNCQESIGQVKDLEINRTVVITYNGSTDTYWITGIDYELSPSRLMATIHVRKA